MNATKVFPQPRPVYLGDPRNGGRLYLAMQMKLRHLGLLQALLETQKPHPYYEVGRKNPDEDADSYHDRLLDALDACESWPPSISDPKMPLHESKEDRETRMTFELYIGLRLDKKPRLSRAFCAELLETVYVDQWDAFQDVLWGADLRKRIIRLLDAEFAADANRDPADMPSFSETVDSISRTRNWGYKEIGNLYLSQWYCVLKAGKLDEEELISIPNNPIFKEEYNMPGHEADRLAFGEQRFRATMAVVERQWAKFARRKPQSNGNGEGS